MYYRSENPHGGTAVPLDFSININPLGTPPAVLAAARRALDETWRYPDPGCRALIAALAARAGTPEDRILCGAGASELIYAWCGALKPRTALEAAPTFSEYSAALHLHGGRVLRHPLRRETGFALDRGILETLAAEKPEALFLCNPNNPTGRRIDPELLDGLLRLCRETGTRVLLDECFLSLSGDGGGSLIPRLEEFQNLTVLRAFTKSYALAGLRLGCVFSADRELLRRMSLQTPPWNVSNVAQAAGLAALEDPDFLIRSRALIAEERAFLTEGLRSLGLWVCPSEANFVLLEGPETLGAHLPRHGVALRDCRNFPGLGPGWYRAAVRGREDNAALLAAIGEEV